MLLMLLFALPGAARAQHNDTGQPVPVVARTPFEREMQKKLICMCGGCGRQLLSECQCGMAFDMRAELASLVNEGRTEEQIVQYYVAKYGSQEPLAAPIDEGFNRLAWAVPYLIGLGSFGVLGAIAVRWTRRREAAPALDPAPADVELEARLDEELRDLD